MTACEQGHIEAARLLAEKGADVNAQDESAARCVSEEIWAVHFIWPDFASRKSKDGAGS